MQTTAIILAVLSGILFGFSVGILVSMWYYEKVIKPVDDEQKGGASKDEIDRLFWDCEAN